MRRFSIFLIAGFLFFYCKKNGGDGSSAVGNSSGAAAYQTSAQIGAAGGTINDPNGQWTFTVPAGALSETKTITVTTNATPVGSVPQEFATSASLLKLEPSGLTFLTPATLKVTYPQGEMSEGGVEEKSQKQYYINDDSTVTAMATTINTTTNEITAQVPHFTITGTLKTNITRVNSGSITRPSRVRRIANNLITYFNNLGSDAARNAEFQLAANNPMLLAFLNKLVQILGSDIFTAAFPNADFDGDGTVNSADPIVAVNGANVTLVSSGSLFVSTNPGAINSTQFVWRSSATGTYSIRLNGTNCSDGTQLASGAVTQNVDNTYTPINASALIDGDNEFRVCVTTTPGPITRFLMVEIARDEVLPVSSASPAGGTYSTAQNVSMSCLDTGAAECAQIAYTTNGTDPTFDALGNVTNGTLVTGMWLTPATGNTTLKVRSRDEAGNIGSVTSYAFNGPVSITYSGNGSSGGLPPIDNSAHAIGSTATVLGNTGLLTKSGFGFIGWNVAADASGLHFLPGANYVVANENNQLFAIWNGDYAARATPEANSWRSVTYGNGQFVAVAHNGSNQVMTSTDGVSWTQRAAPEENMWYSVAYGNGVFVAVAITGVNRVMTSADGISWTARSAPLSQWRAVAFGNNRFVAVAESGTDRVMTSNDGVSWAAQTAASPDAWRWVTYGSNLFVAVGSGCVMTSLDGVVWVSRFPGASSGWNSVAYGNGRYVAVATSGSQRIMTSDNGIDWVARNAPENNQWGSVAYGSHLFTSVAFDGNNRVMVSVDGINWTSRPAAEQNLWSGVSYGNGTFVAVSLNGASRIMQNIWQ